MNEKNTRLIAQIISNSGRESVIGYTVMHLKTKETRVMNIKEVRRIIEVMGCVNAEIGFMGKIKGTEGSLKRLPIVDTDGNLVGNKRIVVLKVYYIEGEKEFRGMKIMDIKGISLRVGRDESIRLMENYGAVNAKLINKDGKIIISAILGELDKVYMEDYRTPEYREKYKDDLFYLDYAVNEFKNQHRRDPDCVMLAGRQKDGRNRVTAHYAIF